METLNLICIALMRVIGGILMVAGAYYINMRDIPITALSQMTVLEYTGVSFLIVGAVSILGSCLAMRNI